VALPPTIQHISIASGGTETAAFVVAKASHASIWCPVVNSGNWFLKASFNTTSANYLRIQNATGSGNYAFLVEAGSKVFPLDDLITAHVNLKIETDTAQTDTRSFVVVTKP